MKQPEQRQNSLRQLPIKKLCAILIITIPAVMAFLPHLWATRWRNDSNRRPGSNFSGKLVDLGILKVTPHTTYRSELVTPFFPLPLSYPISSKPDTTAVVLNWSRLPNVLLISSILCDPGLDDIIAEIFIWNNNPNITLSHQIFESTGCPPGKLRIHNSPENLYFQARFIACADAQTPYCFIQDDDYLIRPEIIQNMRSFLMQNPLRSVHLLPPHEHLTSRLRFVYNRDSNLSASFAWLGHGAYLPQAVASDFLALLHSFNASEEEMQMADNYFTILGNQLPEVWLDHGIELGGGQPFTVGVEGHVRNLRHIARALEYLDAVWGERRTGATKQNIPKIGHSLKTSLAQAMMTTRAPCRLSTCLVETTISLLPENLRYDVSSAQDMLSVEDENRATLGEARTRWYVEYPLSLAVDGKPETAFRSPEHALKGDSITLNTLGAIDNWETSEVVWLVDADTEQILRRCQFSRSLDGHIWTTITNPLVCFKTPFMSQTWLGSQGLADGFEEHLNECSVLIQNNDRSESTRFIQAEVTQDFKGVHEKWSIYELWLRGVTPLGSD